MLSGSEDFAYYLEKIPGCFFFIGCKPKGKMLTLIIIQNLILMKTVFLLQQNQLDKLSAAIMG
ncbi:hypothetical protein [Lederbergia citrisecunda]|uniref:hypothetical protein n=1 Tax=Lederbergia citrisecunda TaxID=2833583 RepID=UPI003D814418